MQKRGRRPLIRQSQEVSVACREPETSERRERFLPPPTSPAGALRSADPPPSFQKTLRPGIVLAVTHKNHADMRSFLECALDQPPSGQRFIVWMRREN